MTEQKEKLQSIRDNLEELLRAPRSDMYDPDEIIENCVSILDELLADQQQTCKVGEYYSWEGRIFRIETEFSEIFDKVCDITYLLGNKLLASMMHENSVWWQNKQVATGDEIALFKRAEHFHSKNRKYSEFKNGDIVQNKKTGKIGYAQHVDEDGDVVVVYKSDKVLNISNYKCTGALYLDLIMTAEELEAAQEARK